MIPELHNRLSSAKSSGADLYAKHYASVGLALVDLTDVCSLAAKRVRKNADDRTAYSAKSSATDEPAQIADRLRLVNHVINQLDSLVDDQISNVLSSDSARKETDSVAKSANTFVSDSRLVKIFVGGTMLGYAVGLLPSKAVRVSRQPVYSLLISKVCTFMVILVPSLRSFKYIIWIPSRI